MTELKKNIGLIGMPGSGKSTVGVLLAKMTSRSFVDTDLLIQAAQGRSLQAIVDMDGYMGLRGIEHEILLNLSCRNSVIATGGSAVYSTAAMEHLSRTATIVFLDADRETLEGRILDFHTRGLAKRPDQTFADLFAERRPLYRKYADVTIDCSSATHEQVCVRIMQELERHPDK